jgi:hypothetical protein
VIENRVEFKLGQSEYSVREYDKLRELFERAVEADRGLVVLRKADS